MSYALSAAKTIPFIRGTRKPPLVRLHLSLGAEDWSLLGKRRHDGIFGGLQFLFTPEFDSVMQHEGHDTIAALLYYMPPRSGLMFKIGSFGPHTWAGVAYKRKM
ncbi:MAG: hypothetical protein IT210_03650 [Armatimonadetes bacterium]|nr:hypothetical protein [Armatimonadota bacterium]